MSLLNIVDEKDNIIGEETRYNIHKKGLLHREANIWIFNKKKEILFQKRGADKDTFPNLLGPSVGGHVEIGDGYEVAAIREIEEETGLIVKDKDLIFIKKIRRKSFDEKTKNTNNVFRCLYGYRYDGSQNLRVEKGKATGFEFWSIDKLENLSDEDKKLFIPSLVRGEDYMKFYEDLISNV